MHVPGFRQDKHPRGGVTRGGRIVGAFGVAPMSSREAHHPSGELGQSQVWPPPSVGVVDTPGQRKLNGAGFVLGQNMENRSHIWTGSRQGRRPMKIGSDSTAEEAQGRAKRHRHRHVYRVGSPRQTTA